MIEIRDDDLFDSGCQALVNAVNSVGVMGKGIALQFRKKFPQNYDFYRSACAEGQVRPGLMFITRTGIESPEFIVNFPTKMHWRDASQIQWIEAGLRELAQDMVYLGIKSIAIPALGCANGGLKWEDVYPLIDKTFSGFSETRVVVYPPQ